MKKSRKRGRNNDILSSRNIIILVVILLLFLLVYSFLKPKILPAPPAVTLTNPADASVTDSVKVYFKADITNDIELKNATVYIWDSSGNLVTTRTSSVYGLSDTAN